MSYDIPIKICVILAADFLHGTVFPTLQAYVVVETIFLELNVYLFEAHHDPFGSGRCVGCLDMKPEVVHLVVRPRIVGGFNFTLTRLN